MKELVKFELKKIFSNKIIYITALAIVILAVVLPNYKIMKNKKYLGSREDVKSIAETYINGDYSKNDIKNLIFDVMNSREKLDEMSKEKRLLMLYPNSFSVGDQKTRDEQIDDITTRINELDVESVDDTYKYNALSKQKEMLEKLPQEENVFIGDWYNMLDFKEAGTFKVILLVVGLAGIFSKEYSSRVSYINLSAKNGRSKLNRAKIIAALIYTTVVFAFVTIVFICTTFYLGLPNGDKSLRCIMDSLYNISINQYVLYTLAFSYFGTLIFAMCIIVLSLYTKNFILECGIPIFLYIAPTVFMLVSFADFIEFIDLSKLLIGEKVLSQFFTMNLFGNAVPYPYAITSFGAMVFIFMILIYRRLGRNQTIA